MDDQENYRLQSLNDNTLQATNGELTNAKIQELYEEDSRVESEIADLQGQIRELCNQHSELPQPQTVFEIAKEVAVEYMSVKGLSPTDLGKALVKTLKHGAARATVVTAIVEIGGMLVKKLINRGELLKKRESLSLQMVKEGN